VYAIISPKLNTVIVFTINYLTLLTLMSKRAVENFEINVLFIKIVSFAWFLWTKIIYACFMYIRI